MRGGRDGNGARRDVEAAFEAAGVDAGEACADEVRAAVEMSSQTRSEPSRRIVSAMALATTLRGASSASGWTPAMKRSPAAFRRIAPSPRSASETRKAELSPATRAVGWNCTNSISRTIAPARRARPSPSAVAPGGLVVWR